MRGVGMCDPTIHSCCPLVFWDVFQSVRSNLDVIPQYPPHALNVQYGPSTGAIHGRSLSHLDPISLGDFISLLHSVCVNPRRSILYQITLDNAACKNPNLIALNLFAYRYRRQFPAVTANAASTYPRDLISLGRLRNPKVARCIRP